MAKKYKRNHNKHSQRKEDYYSSRSIYDLLRDFTRVDYLNDSNIRFKSSNLNENKRKRKVRGISKVSVFTNSNKERRSVYKRNTLVFRPDEERIRQEELRIKKVCRDRKEKRESLFRIGKAGKGKRITKRKIYTEDSKIKCN